MCEYMQICGIYANENSNFRLQNDRYNFKKHNAYAEWWNYTGNKFDNEYKHWSLKTPAFIPNPALYSHINTKFSLLRVLEREYSGICGVIAIFIILLAFRNYSFNVITYDH